MESVFLALVLLACPAVMGGMMWFMMRGQNKRQMPASPADLKAEQARLTQQIDELEGRQTLREPVERGYS